MPFAKKMEICTLALEKSHVSFLTSEKQSENIWNAYLSEWYQYTLHLKMSGREKLWGVSSSMIEGNWKEEKQEEKNSNIVSIITYTGTD